MVRACNTGWACNVLRYIDPNYIMFTILYMVVSRAILLSVLVNASSNRLGPGCSITQGLCEI